MPIIVCAPSGPLSEKTAGDVRDVVARGGRVIFVIDASSRWARALPHVVDLPLSGADPIRAAHSAVRVPTTAVVKGTDADQARNLAKERGPSSSDGLHHSFPRARRFASDALQGIWIQAAPRPEAEMAGQQWSVRLRFRYWITACRCLFPPLPAAHPAPAFPLPPRSRPGG
jgi:hypothetical protein